MSLESVTGVGPKDKFKYYTTPLTYGMVRYLKNEEREKRINLYHMGLSDSEIGKRVGVGKIAITNWRSRNNLPSQTIGKLFNTNFKYLGSKDDLIYIAGFLDGEGSICISKTKRMNNDYVYQASVQIVNTNYEVIKWIESLFKGSVLKREIQKDNCKDKYVWMLRRLTDVKAFLNLISPFLKIKNKQSEIVLKFIELRLNQQFGKRSYGSEEEKLFQENRQLNMRGKH